MVQTTAREPSWAAVLLSRQPLCPSGRTPWVRAAVEAVSWVKRQGLGLLTSVGMQTWELLVFLAQREKICQNIILPQSNNRDFKQSCCHLKKEFELEDRLIRFTPLGSEIKKTGGKALFHSRDFEIITLAEILIPVSIRPGGFMEKFVGKKTSSQGMTISRYFEIPYKKRKQKLGYQIDTDNLSPALEGIGNHYLIHWTRASRGPWPTESRYAFYRDIVNSETYPRGAFETLKNMLCTLHIKSSSLHMPSNIPTVSFSALAPFDAISLMRWRSRYVQMSFEPYGIGVEKVFAKKIGILPVQYYKKGNLPKCERWLTQSIGIKGYWPGEAEYRFRGDLDFSGIPRDKLVVFCYRPSEAEYIAECFGLAAFSIIS